jgi:hypothetical protein
VLHLLWIRSTCHCNCASYTIRHCQRRLRPGDHRVLPSKLVHSLKITLPKKTPLYDPMTVYRPCSLYLIVLLQNDDTCVDMPMYGSCQTGNSPVLHPNTTYNTKRHNTSRLLQNTTHEETWPQQPTQRVRRTSSTLSTQQLSHNGRYLQYYLSRCKVATAVSIISAAYSSHLHMLIIDR